MCLSIQAKRPIVAERQGSLQQRSSTPSSHFSFAMVSGKHCKARQPQHLHRNISAAFLAWHFVPFAVSQAHPTLGFRPTAIPKVSDSPVLSCKASNLSPRSATFVILSVSHGLHHLSIFFLLFISTTIRRHPCSCCPQKPHLRSSE